MDEELDITVLQFSTRPDPSDDIDSALDDVFEEDEKSEPSDVILVNSGHVIVVDSEAALLRVYDQNGRFVRLEGEKHLTSAWGVLQTNSGKIVVSDPASSDLKVFSKNGHYLINSEYGNHLIEPYGIAYHPQTAKVAVCDRSACCVYIHGPDGKVADIVKIKHSDNVPLMKCPSYVAFTKSGGTVVSDMESNCVYCFDEEGDLQWTFGTTPEDHGLACPCGVTVDGDGNTLVADSENSRVVILGRKGQYQGYALTWADGLAEPRGLRLQGDSLSVTEALTSTIKVFDYRKLKGRIQNSYYKGESSYSGFSLK